MAKIWFSVGHGANGDPGAVAYHDKIQYTEYKQCCKILDRAKEIMKMQNITVGYVPLALSLQERIRWVNQNCKGNEMLIEMHMNSAGAEVKGAEMFFRDGNAYYQGLADKYLKAYVKSTGQTSRGAKSDSTTRFKRLGIIRDTVPAALLIELGFITNKAELEVVISRAALGIVNVALSWYNLPFLADYGSQPMKQTPSPWAVAAIEKAKKKGVIKNWEEPQKEVEAYWLTHVLHNLGALKDTTDVLTHERLAVALDNLHLLD